jgi:hypothetical protein
VTKRMSSPIARFVRLDAGQKKLAAEALALLAYAHCCSFCMPTQRLLALGKAEDRSRTPAALDGVNLEKTRACIAALERASRYYRGSNCLIRGTALRLLLTRAGVASTLHVGVRKAGDGKVAAHAWVSVGGRVILGGEQLDQGYVDLLPNRTDKSSESRESAIRPPVGRIRAS